MILCPKAINQIETFDLFPHLDSETLYNMTPFECLCITHRFPLTPVFSFKIQRKCLSGKLSLVWYYQRMTECREVNINGQDSFCLSLILQIHINFDIGFYINC